VPAIQRRWASPTLLETLGLTPDTTPGDLRYQLLHRTASAVIEAERFNATQAMIIVHAFGDDRGGFADFESFAQTLGVEPRRGHISRASTTSVVPLWIGGSDGKCATSRGTGLPVPARRTPA
jgi:hypothetical protein